MGASLSDITIFYHGNEIENKNKNSEFRIVTNYISDFYFRKLNKYKPPKTSAIRLTLSGDEIWDKPFHYGSICNCSALIDESHYLKISSEEKQKYILDIIHNKIIEVANELNWDKVPFLNAYDSILDLNFKFKEEHQLKTSRDRKRNARAIVHKDLLNSYLIIQFDEKESAERELLIKYNWWFYDSIHQLAKKCKWMNKTSFGYENKKENLFSYYCIESNQLFSNMHFGRNDF